MISLYIIGIIVAILFALLRKFTKFKGEPVPFVMELPNYRLPSAKSVYKLIIDKAKDFISKAFTIIFVASIIIWFLQSFDTRLNPVADSENSLLALLGSIIAPIFSPLWRLESINSSYYRIYSKGKCRKYSCSTSWGINRIYINII